MKRIIVVLLLFSSILSNAQNKVSGTVLNSRNNEPVIGAVLYIPFLHKGVMTDTAGNFNCLDVQQGNFDITVSLIGFQTKIISVDIDNLPKELIIYLEEQIFETQEVIVSGNRFSLQHENAIDIKSVKIDINSDLESNFLKALSKQAGVDMISKGNGLQKPVIRGLSNTNILVVDNGIRKENYQFSENHPYLIDDNGIERIEIIKGPASLLYGSDAVGGVIYMLPEKPAMQNTFSGNYKAKYSFNDGGMATSFSLKGAKTNFHAGVNIGLKSYKDYYDAAGTQVHNSRFNNVSFKTNTGISYKFGKSDLYIDYNKIKIGLTIPASIPLIYENSRINEIWFQDLESQIVALKNKLFFKSLMLDADFSYQANRRKLFTSESSAIFNTVDMNLTTFGYNIKGTYSIKNNMQLITGVQGSTQSNKNFDAPNHVIPDANVADFSSYLMFSGNYFKKLHLLAGLRYDYRNIATKEELNKPAVNKSFNNMSYSAGMTFQLTKKILFRSNFASAHRTPNIAELTQNGPHGAIYEIGNSNLQTQVNFEPDLSIHYHSDFFLFEITGFYNKINDYIYLNNTGTFNETGMQIYQYNQSDAAIKGFETGFKLMPHKTIKFYTNYSFIEAKKSDGEYLPFIPQNKIRSEIKFIPDIKVFDFKISTSLETIYAFKQSNEAQFETETPEYFIADLSFNIERKLKKGSFNLALKCSNLFNETYTDHLSTLKEQGYFSQGRNITVVIKHIF